jgi:hypothetical protein
MLFLVAADLSYSVGRWVQLRGPWFEPPTTLRTTGTDLIWTATNNFEEDWNNGEGGGVLGGWLWRRARSLGGGGGWGSMGCCRFGTTGGHRPADMLPDRPTTCPMPCTWVHQHRACKHASGGGV